MNNLNKKREEWLKEINNNVVAFWGYMSLDWGQNEGEGIRGSVNFASQEAEFVAFWSLLKGDRDEVQN